MIKQCVVEITLLNKMGACQPLFSTELIAFIIFSIKNTMYLHLISVIAALSKANKHLYYLKVNGTVSLSEKIKERICTFLFEDFK